MPLKPDTDGNRLRLLQRYALTTVLGSRGASNQCECIWYGVKCDENGYVTRLTLEPTPDVRIAITLSKDLGLLRSLTYVYTNNNDLGGTIPSALGEWKDMRTFFGTQLTGDIPSELEAW